MSKHIEVHYDFVQEKILADFLDLRYIGTHKEVTDFHEGPLQKHCKHSENLGYSVVFENLWSVYVYICILNTNGSQSLYLGLYVYILIILVSVFVPALVRRAMC